MKNKLIHQWKTFEAPELDEQGNLKNPLRKEDKTQGPKKKKSGNSDSDEEEVIDQD